MVRGPRHRDRSRDPRTPPREKWDPPRVSIRASPSRMAVPRSLRSSPCVRPISNADAVDTRPARPTGPRPSEWPVPFSPGGRTHDILRLPIVPEESRMQQKNGKSPKNNKVVCAPHVPGRPDRTPYLGQQSVTRQAVTASRTDSTKSLARSRLSIEPCWRTRHPSFPRAARGCGPRRARLSESEAAGGTGRVRPVAARAAVRGDGRGREERDPLGSAARRGRRASCITRASCLFR